MSERFCPVPYRALSIVGPAHRLAVLDLYLRGHEASWEEVHVTERLLTVAWGCSARQVWAVLDALASAGLISVVRGDKRSNTRVRVRCPTAEARVEHAGSTGGAQVEHNSTDTTPAISDAEAQPKHSRSTAEALPAASRGEIGRASGDREETREENREETDTMTRARPGMPGWATRAAIEHGVDADAVLEHVVDVLTRVRQTLQNPLACGPDAAHVLRLWSELGRPAWDSFEGDVELVARACRDSPDAVFARHVRGVGWAGKVDTSRSPKAVLRPEDWHDRLAAARAWEAGGAPVDTVSPSTPTVPDAAILARLDAGLAELDRAPKPREVWMRWPHDWRGAMCEVGGDLSPFVRQYRDESTTRMTRTAFVAALRQRGPVDITWGGRHGG